jgi:putative membrane protein
MTSAGARQAVITNERNAMLTNEDIRHFLLVLIYSALGLAIFTGGFKVLDRLTPGELRKEIIEEHNVALAILVGACVIGVSLIIAAALSG